MDSQWNRWKLTLQIKKLRREAMTSTTVRDTTSPLTPPPHPNDHHFPPLLPALNPLYCFKILNICLFDVCHDRRKRKYKPTTRPTPFLQTSTGIADHPQLPVYSNPTIPEALHPSFRIYVYTTYAFAWPMASRSSRRCSHQQRTYLDRWLLRF